MIAAAPAQAQTTPSNSESAYKPEIDAFAAKLIRCKAQRLTRRAGFTCSDQDDIEQDLAVLLIAHAKVEKFEDPESSPYDRYSPRLHKHAAALLTEWSDAVLFATRKIRTQSEEAGFNRKRTIAHGLGKDGGERILRCVGGPSCIAKNRYGIVEELPLSWPAFMAALSNNQPQGEPSNG